MNLLEALGVTAREDVITNLLAHCYNNSAVFRSSFLHALGVPFDSPSGTAYTLVLSGDSGVPDIVLANPDGTRRTIVVIEHKLGAEEGEDQTVRYSSPECLAQLAARFSLDTDVVPH